MKKNSALQVVKFVLFSASAGIIQFAVVTLLNEVAGMKWIYSYIIGLTLSVLWNFTFNRKYTFKSDGNVGRAMLLVFLFYLIFAPVSTIGGNQLEKIGWPGIWVTVLVMVCNLVFEFLYLKFVVYRTSKESKIKL